MPIEDCPYGSCGGPPGERGCANVIPEETSTSSVYQRCGAERISRIVKRCQNCRCANQSLAKFCRRCGAELRNDLPAPGGLFANWTQPAASVATHDIFAIPQLAAAGDLTISFHGTEFVLSYLSDGSRFGSIPFPGGPSLSATPLVVKERIYLVASELLWEYSLSTSDLVRIPVQGFNPSKCSRPISVSYKYQDYIIVAGESGVLVVRARRPDYERKVFDVRMEDGDAFLSLVHHPTYGIVLTTRLGKIWRLAFDYSPLDGKGGFLQIQNLGNYYLSAPNYNSSTDTIYAECVRKNDLRRYFLRFSPNNKTDLLKLLPVAEPTESYESEAQLRILQFPLQVSGVFAIARSMGAPSVVHFISPSQIQTVSVTGLNMDPLCTAIGHGSIFSVKDGQIQKFKDAAAPQVAETVPAALGGGESIVNRPLYHMGRLVIQQENQLLAWEV